MKYRYSLKISSEFLLKETKKRQKYLAMFIHIEYWRFIYEKINDNVQHAKLNNLT